jgi:hypothetical protein
VPIQDGLSSFQTYRKVNSPGAHPEALGRVFRCEMARSLPDLMRTQAEASIASHSGTGPGNWIAGNSRVKLAGTMELYAYWNRLRGRRSAPERNDVDPAAIRGVLADTFVLDFDARLGFPVRIAGSRANALFLKDLRGLSFFELWRGADREDLAWILHCVADEAQAFLIGAEAGPPGYDAVDIEVILLPLRHHGLTHSRVLGGLAFHATPSWMGLTAAGPIALTSLRALEPSTRKPLALEDAAAAGFSLRNMPRRHKHLFVYSGDRPAT